MILKTDYKDDIYAEKRKFRMINNPDGTVSFEDVTVYTQTGSEFGAGDINSTNKEINDRTTKIFKFKVPASGWVGEMAPWTQTVQVPGMVADGTPFKYLQKWSKEQEKAMSLITDGKTFDGRVEFVAGKPGKKPVSDIDMVIKVVY